MRYWLITQEYRNSQKSSRGNTSAPSVRCGAVHESASILIDVGRGVFLIIGEEVGDMVVSIGGGMIVTSEIEGIILNLGLMKPKGG